MNLLKFIVFLFLDGYFLYALFAFGDEMGGYITLFLIAIAFFTWELIRSIKEWFE